MAKLLFNGNWVDENDSVFIKNTRVWQFGEGLFESIRVINGQAPLLKSHSERLYNSSRVLGWALPPFWNTEFWKKEIEKFCKEYKWQNARIKILVFRQGGGAYLPDNEFFNWIISGRELQSNKFELNEKGLSTIEFSEIPKSEDILSILKTTSSLRYIQSALYARRFGADEVLVTNQSGRICEAGSSNLFIVQEEELLTPPISEYCMNGIMRNHILELAKQLGIEAFETPLMRADIKNANEVFLTNSIKGIQWVNQFESVKFELGEITKKLADALNEL